MCLSAAPICASSCWRVLLSGSVGQSFVSRSLSCLDSNFWFTSTSSYHCACVLLADLLPVVTMLTSQLAAFDSENRQESTSKPSAPSTPPAKQTQSLAASSTLPGLLGGPAGVPQSSLLTARPQTTVLLSVFKRHGPRSPSLDAESESATDPLED